MVAATVTTKGQVTIPLAVRNALNLNPGSKIDFIETAGGEFKIVALNQNVQTLKGILKKKAKPVAIEDMNEAIAEMAVKGMEP